MNRKTQMRNVQLLSICIGIVYLWFGFLKFFPGISPAENLAKNTIHELTLGLIPDQVSYIMLAIWETGLGILFLFNYRRKWVIYLALLHMICTFTPLIFFPEISFQSGSPALTLIGQYIIKNVVIIAALIVVFPPKTSLGEKESVSSADTIAA